MEKPALLLTAGEPAGIGPELCAMLAERHAKHAFDARFVLVGDRDLLTVETTRGAAQTISTGKYSLTSRGGRGRELLQRGEFTRILPTVPELPILGESRN